MPNTSHVMGLRPIEQPFGNIRCNYYEAATGAALYMYQPVDLNSSGRIVAASWNSGNLIVGSVVGFADDSFCPLPNPYLAANPGFGYTVNSAGLVKVLVADDPNQHFVIEEDTGGSALDAQSVGAGASFIFQATTGNNTSGMANAVLDRSGIDTGALQQFRLIKKWDKPDNAYGNFCKWVVKINQHRYTSSTSGALV